MGTERIARVLGWIGKAGLGALLLSLALHFVHVWIRGATVIPLYLIVHGAAFVLMVVAVLARALVLAAKEAQPRLAELLATIAVLSLTLAGWLPSDSGNDPGWVFEVVLKSSFAAVVVAFGALWGWSAIRRLNESRTWARLLVLAAGWAALPGVFAAGYGILRLWRSLGWEPHAVLVAVFAMAVTVPAIIVERRAFRCPAPTTPPKLET